MPGRCGRLSASTAIIGRDHHLGTPVQRVRLIEFIVIIAALGWMSAFGLAAAQAAVRIEENDTLESLSAKVHATEHALLPAVIARLSEGFRFAKT